MKKKRKPLAQGVFINDVYEVNDRYPLDTGQCFSREEIDAMFNLEYPKGTKLFLWDDGEKGNPLLTWYLEDGGGGWTADWSFAKQHIKKIS